MRSVRVIFSTLALTLLAAAPATLPTRRPQVETWIAQLADRDVLVRDAARIWLMDLSSSELPLLRACVTEHPPRPVQADTLRDVVVHILTRDALRRLPSSGQPYIGVQHDLTYDPLAVDPQGNVIPTIGTIVHDVLPGSPAAREMQSGDIIMGMAVGGLGTAWLTDHRQLREWVLACPPGEAITFVVRRAGSVMRVRIVPESRPAPTEAAVANDPIWLAETAITMAYNAQLEANHVFDEQWGTLPGMGR